MDHNPRRRGVSVFLFWSFSVFFWMVRWRVRIRSSPPFLASVVYLAPTEGSVELYMCPVDVLGFGRFSCASTCLLKAHLSLIVFH